MVGPEDSNEIDQYFEQQKGLYYHLEQNVAHDWVAEDTERGIVGWARSIERDNHLQLTHFFVDTNCQGSGTGRELLKRAFPLEKGEQRSVIATTNPGALSLYLRYGVSFQGMALGFYGTPQTRESQGQLEVERAEPSAETLQNIVDIDARILGYRRPVDLEFFMHNQPVYLFRQQKELVAYAFGSNGHSAGPAAALEPEYLPELLHHIEQEACHGGVESLYLNVPAQAREAVSWALSSGYRIDPFHEILLARHPTMQLDRFIMASSGFVW